MTIARAATLLPAVLLTALATPAAAQPDADPVGCRVEMVPMRDGVRLATEGVPAGRSRPPSGGSHAAALYTRGSLAAGSNCDNPRLLDFARRGYAGLSQDARGRYR